MRAVSEGLMNEVNLPELYPLGAEVSHAYKKSLS